MSNEIALIEIKHPAAVFVTNGLDPLLERIRAEVKKEAPNLDISTEAGRKAIASLAYKIAKSKTKLDEIGKTLTDDQRMAIAAVNKERSRVWDELEKLQAEVRKPLTDWEKAEEERVKWHEDCLATLAALDKWPDFHEPTAGQIEERLIAHPAHFDRNWQEFAARATTESDRVVESLNKKLSARKKADADAAELKRLREEQEAREKKEREEKIAADAAAEAKKLAEEKAEQDRIAREAEVERERKATADKVAAALKKSQDEKDEQDRQRKKAEDDKAAEKARADKAEADRITSEKNAETARVAAEKKAAEDKKKAEDAAAQRERDRIAAEQETERKALAAREADQAHKKKINNEALAAIDKAASIGDFKIPPASAQAIIIAIAQGKVPHVKINY